MRTEMQKGFCRSLPFMVVLFSALVLAAGLAMVIASGGLLSWNTQLFVNDDGLLSSLFLFAAVATLLYDCRSTNWDPFSPFRLFYSTWFGVLALGCLRLTNAEPPFTLRFWGTVSLGLAGFYVGGQAALRDFNVSNRVSLGRLREYLELKWRPRCSLLLVGFLFLVGGVAFGYEYLKAGGVPLFADDPEAARFEFGVNSLLSRLVVSLDLVAVLGYCGAIHLRKYRVLFLFMTVASLVPFALMTARVFILTAAWMIVVLYHYGRRSISLKALLVIILIAYPLAKMVVDVKRFQQNEAYNKLLDRVEFPERLRSFAPEYLYFSMTLRTLDYLTHLVPEEINYSHGWYTAYPVRVFWTPRQGMGFRGRLDDLFWDRAGDVSPVASVTTSFMGVPYADFGLVGVFLFSCVFGWISVRSYESMRRQPNFWRVFLYSQISFAIFWSIYANYLTLFDFYWNLAVVGLIHRFATDRAEARVPVAGDYLLSC